MAADPTWVAARRREQDARDVRTARLLEAEAPLIEDLARVGVRVRSSWDLVNTADPYPSAIPVLLRHLRHSYPDEIIAGIARALAVKDARLHAAEIAKAYEDTDESAMPHAKDGLAVAVALTCDQEVVERLIVDPANGSSRMLLLMALRRKRNPTAVALVDRLAGDPVFAKEIASWKRRPKS
jgi:hypothetical protein